MDPNWTDVVTALAAAFALALAGLAWFTSMNALRTTYRPVVRTIPSAIGHGRAELKPHALILKNVGFGPALSVMLYEAPARNDNDPMTTHPIVEPLRDGPEEKSRPGRIVLSIENGSMKPGKAYRLLYQDVAGGWHETWLRFNETELTMKLLGPRRWYHVFRPSRYIPRSAKARSVVVRAHEGV
jgi:hypothetical protein